MNTNNATKIKNFIDTIKESTMLLDIESKAKAYNNSEVYTSKPKELTKKV